LLSVTGPTRPRNGGFDRRLLSPVNLAIVNYGDWVPHERLTRVNAAALIAATMLLAACSDFDEARSHTPRITVDEDAETNLVSRLLTVEQVEKALGGSGLSQADISETPIFENPDPRGPCGAVVPQFRLGEGTVGRSFGASNITIVQFITPTSTVTSAFLDAIVGDALPGCSAFESETNLGLMQQVSEIEIVDVTSAPTGAVAYTSRVDIGGQTAYVAAVAVADREVTTYLQVFAQDRIDSRALQALTAAANDALRRAE
jgi:hypothetical protein